MTKEKDRQTTLEIRKLKGIIRCALKHSIANLGSKDEFYRCHTYPHGEMPDWVLSARAAVNINGPEHTSDIEKETYSLKNQLRDVGAEARNLVTEITDLSNAANALGLDGLEKRLCSLWEGACTILTKAHVQGDPE